MGFVLPMRPQVLLAVPVSVSEPRLPGGEGDQMLPAAGHSPPPGNPPGKAPPPFWKAPPSAGNFWAAPSAPQPVLPTPSNPHAVATAGDGSKAGKPLSTGEASTAGKLLLGGVGADPGREGVAGAAGAANMLAAGSPLLKVTHSARCRGREASAVPRPGSAGAEEGARLVPREELRGSLKAAAVKRASSAGPGAVAGGRNSFWASWPAQMESKPALAGSAVLGRKRCFVALQRNARPRSWGCFGASRRPASQSARSVVTALGMAVAGRSSSSRRPFTQLLLRARPFAAAIAGAVKRGPGGRCGCVTTMAAGAAFARGGAASTTGGMVRPRRCHRSFTASPASSSLLARSLSASA
mmetsp:Transcript_59081/g.175743  ORF Transcript_59081/g.175743 Transcript_59081/m.175743 type:complete len:354 (+) Transcript_59081:251-1312(+)